MYNFFRTRSGGEEKERYSNRERGDGVGLAGVVKDGLGEHERAVLGLVLFVVGVVVGGEVDAGAALQGGEEGGGDGGANPVRQTVKLLEGN